MGSFHKIFILGLLLTAFWKLDAQKPEDHYDGPYIELNGDSLLIEWIESGVVKSKKVIKEEGLDFDVPGLPYISISTVSPVEQIKHKFEDVSKFVALSDIHGQYDVAIKLLESNKVIDKFGHWSYGDGHLVIVGDILDRGPKVTETLWFLYQLELEALEAGGRVHILLGNHELMILHGDIQYINPRYRYTMAYLKKSIPDLFKVGTVLGDWLRSKNICSVINDVFFVHGGISPKVLEYNLTLEKINDVFTSEILPSTKSEIETSELQSLLYFENGPLWYRGYANPQGFKESTADSILNYFNVNHLVVGHTSMPRIVPIHNSKILLIDSSIKFGKKGELLIYESGEFTKGTMQGERLSLDRIEVKDASSPFEYVYQFNDNDLTLILDMDLDYLLKGNRMKGEYQDATLIAVHNFEFNREWDIRIKTRGNMRKQACHLPPLKIDFAKETLDYLGFSTNDKLKLVLPCNEGSIYQQGLYKEHFIYQLYQLVDSFGIRTHLVNVILKDDGKTRYKTQGFFIEDKLDFNNRTNSKTLEEGIIVFDAIDREQYLKMMFFQYLIMNTDFADYTKHNLQMISVEGEKRPRAIPYDFDYSGMVNQDYAVPHEKIPISDVREYYFRGKNLTIEELLNMKDYYEALRPEMDSLLDSADYLSESSRESIRKDIDQFFKRLSDEGKWKKRFLTPRKMKKK